MSSRSLPFSIQFFLQRLRKVALTFRDAAILLVAPEDRRLQGRLLTVIQHMLWYCKLNCDFCDLNEWAVIR